MGTEWNETVIYHRASRHEAMGEQFRQAIKDMIRTRSVFYPGFTDDPVYIESDIDGDSIVLTARRGTDTGPVIAREHIFLPDTLCPENK